MAKMVAKTLLLSSALLLAQIAHAQSRQVDRKVYENYSFDFSAHKRPIAYTTYGNALELNSKVKLNPAVADRYGAYVFDGKLKDDVFEIELEFTVASELNSSRGFMVMLSQNEFQEEEFSDSQIGYRTDFEGFSVYVFRH